MDQAKIQLKLVKSPLPGVKDDYTAIVVTNGTATGEDIVAGANAAEPQISEIAAKQVFDTEWLYIGRMLAEGKHVNIGGIGLAPGVDGSLLHADEEVDSGRIGIQVTIYDNALIQALKSMDVATATDPDALPFVFTKVEDVSTNTFGVLTPGGAFKTLGDRQSCGLEGERIEIVDAAGTKHVIADATGDREGMWLLATAPATLAKGKASVTVFSRGKNTPEAEPTPSAARSVTVLASATPPEPRTVSVTTERCARDGSPNTLAVGSASEFVGENLDTVEAVTWREEAGPGGITGTVGREHWQANGDGTVLTLDETVPGEIKAATGADGIIAFVFTSHGGVPGSAQQSVKHGGLVFSA